MRQDSSLIILLVIIALSYAAHTQTTPAPEPPTEELRIGDVAEVAEIDPVKDANAEKGWYKKTKGGWMFWPEGTVDESKPPKMELAAFANQEMAESAVGLALLALPFILIVGWKRRARRKANDSEMKRVSGGVSQAEFHALIRKLSNMEQILHNLTPDDAEGKNGRKKRWII